MAWLPSASTTVEPARSDMVRCAGGGIIRSSVATRYQLGLVRQAIAEELSPIREVELIQQHLDIDAQIALVGQAARLPELEEAFVKVAASWTKRSGITAAALREVGVPARVIARAGL
jgi:hypothetical protein